MVGNVLGKPGGGTGSNLPPTYVLERFLRRKISDPLSLLVLKAFLTHLIWWKETSFNFRRSWAQERCFITASLESFDGPRTLIPFKNSLSYYTAINAADTVYAFRLLAHYSAIDFVERTIVTWLTKVWALALEHRPKFRPYSLFHDATISRKPWWLCQHLKHSDAIRSWATRSVIASDTYSDRQF